MTMQRHQDTIGGGRRLGLLGVSALALLAGSAIVGFALARIVKAGMGVSADAAGPRANEPNVGRIDV